MDREKAKENENEKKYLDKTSKAKAKLQGLRRERKTGEIAHAHPECYVLLMCPRTPRPLRNFVPEESSSAPSAAEVGFSLHHHHPQHQPL